jgi:DNA-directed RNA polymerase subunit RPC12/RpoP
MTTAFSSSLEPKECSNCGFVFNVADSANYVCTNCYHHAIPKYVKPRRKQVKDGFAQFLTKDPELIGILMGEAAVWKDYVDRDEQEYVEHICKVLREEGIVDYEINKPCLTGVIDIYIPAQNSTLGSHKKVVKSPQIIEVKRSNAGTNLKSALGQLLFYSTAHPDASLFIATPAPLQKWQREIFRLYDIEEWG